ncbi:MAG TPA: cell division protein FtsZ [Bacteroidales bacterium]|nr:cell division protein FtsZ [Bacteroidales bacterium]
MTEYRFEFEENNNSIIKVIGVGGGGSNAVNQMFREGIRDVDFVVCNTDLQALKDSPIPRKVQLGKTLTEGLGAGNKPEQGREAAIESLKDIEELLDKQTKMVFITAGMGGGTGTGAAPVIAEAARKRGILTVGIVTIPFKFEGKNRLKSAVEGIEAMRPLVDSLLIINNERLQKIYGKEDFSVAFKRADNVLLTAAKGIAEVITVHGYINVDFEDVKTVMKDSGVALMGSSRASGEDRAMKAIKDALTSPLLNDNDIIGAKDILLNLTYGMDEIKMDEITEITNYIEESVGDSSNIIWGTGNDESLEDDINVTIIATGFETASGLYEQTKTKRTHVEKEEDVPKTRPVDGAENPQQGTLFPGPEDENDISGGEKDEKYGHLKNIDDMHEDEQLDELERKPAYKRSMDKSNNSENQNN